jgi:hypothetical protein
MKIFRIGDITSYSPKNGILISLKFENSPEP